MKHELYFKIVNEAMDQFGKKADEHELTFEEKAIAFQMFSNLLARTVRENIGEGKQKLVSIMLESLSTTADKEAADEAVN